MGYTTSFTGTLSFDRPLTVLEYNTLKEFADEGHWDDENVFPDGYCQWVPTRDGAGLEWDGGEKFYNYTAWLRALIKKFFAPWGIKLNGSVKWHGEGRDDTGTITVRDNVVTDTKDCSETDDRRLVILRAAMNAIGSIASTELGRAGASDHVRAGVLSNIKNLVDKALTGIREIENAE